MQHLNANFFSCFIMSNKTKKIIREDCAMSEDALHTGIINC